MDWQKLYDNLYEVYGTCTCPLKHASAFQLLVAVMLSAQCRDERVNKVTEVLFAQAPDAESMIKLGGSGIADIIKPCGLYKVKSRNIVAAAAMIVEKFNGKVPETMEELVTVPGIGRKSANVILGNFFRIPGFPVDTHVNRLLNRIGAVKSKDPEKIEKIVNKAIPSDYWTNFSHLLIFHGRAVCHAGKPECGKCVLNDMCVFYKKGNK